MHLLTEMPKATNYLLFILYIMENFNDYAVGLYLRKSFPKNKINNSMRFKSKIHYVTQKYCYYTY